MTANMCAGHERNAMRSGERKEREIIRSEEEIVKEEQQNETLGWLPGNFLKFVSRRFFSAFLDFRCCF